MMASIHSFLLKSIKYLRNLIYFNLIYFNDQQAFVLGPKVQCLDSNYNIAFGPSSIFGLVVA